MIQRILVPLDGSGDASALIASLRPLLIRSGAELLLFRAVDVASHDEARRYLEGLVERLAAEGVRAQSRVRIGPAASAIIDAAAEPDVSLIAMTTHGLSGVARLTLGSVTEKVIRSSPKPLLVFRTLREKVRSPDHILVPVDASERALDALPYVTELSKLFGARVTLVHFASDYEGKDGMERGQSCLEAARRRLEEHGVSPHAELLRGSPAPGILDYGIMGGSETNAPDMIAMPTHGRVGLRRLMFGSVTEEVLRRASVPMLVVPQRAREQGYGSTHDR